MQHKTRVTAEFPLTLAKVPARAPTPVVITPRAQWEGEPKMCAAGNGNTTTRHSPLCASSDREDAHIHCRQSSSVPPHLCPLSSYTQYTIPPVEWILYIPHIWCGIPGQTCALSRHHNHSFVLFCAVCIITMLAASL